jgi:ABC-type oligopeptide transport system ATPase subunit
VSTLKVDQVSKLFRATSRGGGLTPALRKVSFELNQGEVISLIGESGSGKTTIGKIILRLVQPTSGTVTFDDKDISSYSARGLRDYYRNVQGVFQDPFSSYNPIYRADRVFELVRDVYFKKLSDKQWHDKIDAALDAVTLNPGDVLGKYHYVSDRTIILRHGAIVEMGATQKVFGSPQHDYTRMLMTAVPELHKKWRHTPLGAVAVASNGQAVATDVIEASPSGPVAPALAHITMLDELTHAEQVVKRDFRAVFGGTRKVSSKSSVAVSLEPPELHEFEPDHLVAEPE